MGFVLFNGTQFLSKKSDKNSIFFPIFLLQKINVLRFKMVSNGKSLKYFDEISYKIPDRPFLEKFENVEEFEKLAP